MALGKVLIELKILNIIHEKRDFCLSYKYTYPRDIFSFFHSIASSHQHRDYWRNFFSPRIFRTFLRFQECLDGGRPSYRDILSNEICLDEWFIIWRWNSAIVKSQRKKNVPANWTLEKLRCSSSTEEWQMRSIECRFLINMRNFNNFSAQTLTYHSKIDYLMARKH